MSAPVPAAPPLTAGADLRLFVRCHEHLLSLPASGVERIVLADEVPAPRGFAAFGVHDETPPASLGILSASGTLWSAWDLGLLLGLPPLRAAWMLLRQEAAGGSLRLALRTGRCLHVGPLTQTHVLSLPAGVTRARPGLVRAAFASDLLRLRQQGDAPVGIDLDLAHLWNEDERRFAEDILARVEAASRSEAGDA